jgi:hypothetical protein
MRQRANPGGLAPWVDSGPVPLAAVGFFGGDQPREIPIPLPAKRILVPGLKLMVLTRPRDDCPSGEVRIDLDPGMVNAVLSALSAPRVENEEERL